MPHTINTEFLSTAANMNALLTIYGDTTLGSQCLNYQWPNYSTTNIINAGLSSVSTTPRMNFASLYANCDALNGPQHSMNCIYEPGSNRLPYAID